MRKLRVGFIEFYRQWPGYFTDTFNAAYAGALSEAGHDARIFRIFLHERSQEVILEAHQALTAAGPFDVLVFDRVWDGALLHTGLIKQASTHERLELHNMMQAPPPSAAATDSAKTKRHLNAQDYWLAACSSFLFPLRHGLRRGELARHTVLAQTSRT